MGYLTSGQYCIVRVVKVIKVIKLITVLKETFKGTNRFPKVNGLSTNIKQKNKTRTSIVSEVLFCCWQ
jgi:hypothetical protein